MKACLLCSAELGHCDDCDSDVCLSCGHDCQPQEPSEVFCPTCGDEPTYCSHCDVVFCINCDEDCGCFSWERDQSSEDDWDATGWIDSYEHDYNFGSQADLQHASEEPRRSPALDESEEDIPF